MMIFEAIVLISLFINGWLIVGTLIGIKNEIKSIEFPSQRKYKELEGEIEYLKFRIKYLNEISKSKGERV